MRRASSVRGSESIEDCVYVSTPRGTGQAGRLCGVWVGKSPRRYTECFGHRSGRQKAIGFCPGTSNMVADEPGLSWGNVDWLGMAFEYGLHLALHGSIHCMAGRGGTGMPAANLTVSYIKKGRNGEVESPVLRLTRDDGIHDSARMKICDECFQRMATH